MRKIVYTLGGDTITLDDNNHIATGGEGSVYIKGNKAYKLYLEPERALRAGMDEKWKLLASIKHPNIITPEDAIIGKNQEFLGLVFPVAKGTQLCETLSNGWWTRNGFTFDQCGEAVLNMRESMAMVHKHNALMVDCNEMNWLLDGSSVNVIDTDSWQIGKFRATAILPSVQDPHFSTFTELTDWYSWAIVTFQMWTGVHPFRGNHPVHGRDWAERMKLNASVFDLNVRLPPSVRAIDNIPPALRKWYQMMFSSTNRDLPPTVFDKVQGTVNRTVSNLRSLKLTQLYQATSKIKACINGVIIFGEAGKLQAVDLISNKALPLSSALCEGLLKGTNAIVREGATLYSLELDIPNKKANLTNLGSGLTGSLLTRATRVWQSQNRVFLYEEQGTSLQEVSLSSTAKIVIGSIKQWSCYPQSTKFHRHAYIQTLYGNAIVGVLSDTGMSVLPAKALNDYNVLQMSYVDEKNLWVLGQNKKSQDYTIIRMEVNRSSVDIAETFHTDSPILNIGCAYPSENNAIGLVMLEDGLCMHRKDKQKLMTNETIGTLLTGLPYMAMLDENRVFKVESV